MPIPATELTYGRQWALTGRGIVEYQCSSKHCSIWYILPHVALDIMRQLGCQGRVVNGIMNFCQKGCQEAF